MPERWTRTVLRFRIGILGVWVALLAFGVWSSTRLPSLLSNSFVVPGTDSERAQSILARGFGERPDGTFTVVFRVGHPSDRELRARLAGRVRLAAHAVPTGRPDVLRRGAGVLFADVDTTLDLKHAKRYTEALRDALPSGPGPPAYVTGQPAIQHDLDRVFTADRHRGEAIAVPIALLVLLAVLGLSLAALIPFLFAACTITTTLAAVYALAHSVSMVTYVTNLVELIGLGLAVDYSLLVVYRFREEMTPGRRADEAIVRTMATAGRAVVFSGIAVAIGLGLMLLMPVPFIRSMGVAGLLIPLVSIAATVTLQPALLSLLGRRGLRRARIFDNSLGWLRPARSTEGDGDFWRRLAGSIMRRPVAFLVAGAALLLAAAVPTFFIELTPASISGIPGSLESARGFALLRDRVGPGAITPIEIVVDAGTPGAARARLVEEGVRRLGDELARDGEAYVIASGERAPYVDRTGRYARLIVVGRHEYGDPSTRGLVRRVRARLVARAGFPPGTHVYAGGIPPQGVDFLARSYGTFPWLVLASLVLTYLVLMRAFRSIVLPLKAVVLNMLPVAAAYGILVLAFRWGLGSDLFGLYRIGQVEGWIPIFLFAVLFGLSMDYEVFLVSRMREAWDQVPDNARAITHGLEQTGRIVTAAALIMVAAFSGFVAGRVAALQEFGLGLAAAVFLDATIVRALLVPSVMALLGRFNWWLPDRVARAARIAPSPLRPRR